MNRVVRTIPATRREDTSEPLNQHRKRRVAAYARVSTDTEEQQTSYDAQVSYYTQYIKGRLDWQFVKVYTDEGVTGTNTKHRTGFNQMVKDAIDGKIDLIITKSVSRFARNTVDSLSTIRKLKEHKVECFFEKENIWTFDSKGELLITIMSSLAQEESRSISENVKWGKRKSFAEGKVYIPYKSVLGYKKGPNGNIVIDEEEAKLVRYIYSLYLKGGSYTSIAKRLNEEGYTTVFNKPWSNNSVGSILKNEKYKGDALIQKHFVEDFLTKKLKKNKGEVPQYYVANNHEPIIAPEVFDSVQAEIRRRREQNYSGRNMFGTRIVCEECGGPCGPQLWHSKDKYRRLIYKCTNRVYGRTQCSTKRITEGDIKEGFVEALNSLLTNRDEIIENLQLLLQTLSHFDANRVKQLELELQGVVSEFERLIQMNASAGSAQWVDATRTEELSKRHDELLLEIESEKKRTEDRQARIVQLKTFIQTLEKQEQLITEFRPELWFSLVEVVKRTTRDTLIYHFHDGSTYEYKTKD